MQSFFIMTGRRSFSRMRLLRALFLLPIMTLAQHLRHHSPEQQQLQQQLHEKSSKLRALQIFPEDKVERHRRTATVERVDTGECLFGSFIQTPFNGFATSAGTIFTVIPAVNMDVLTLEFDIDGSAQDLRAVVFYREGGFSGLINDRTQWTFLASSVAQPTPGERGAIIPDGDFIDTPLVAGTLYSFYIHFPGGGLRFASSDFLIGEDFFTDDRNLMTFQVGVSLNEGPFPNRFIEPSEFNGRLHYKTIQNCETLRESSTVDLEFVIDAEVAPEVLGALSETVRRAVEALIAIVPEIIDFAKFDELEVNGEVSNFLGRSEELCPPSYELCTLATTTVEFLHLPTITSGEIRRAVLSNEDIIADSVKTQSLFELEYIGESVNELEFIFTFFGIPPGVGLNDVQQRFFEVETINFLESRSDILLHVALVNEQIVSEAENDVGTIEIRRKRRLRSRQGRRVQATDGLQLLTTVYASAAERDIRAAVLDGIDSDKQTYLQYLFEQQLRPGDISTDNSGVLFANLEDVVVGLNRPAPAPIVEEPPSDNTLWIAFCITLIAVSFFWLVWRVFKDFLYSPKLKQAKLDDSDPMGGGGRRQLRRGGSFDDINPRMAGKKALRSRSEHGDPLGARGRSRSPSKKKGAPKRARSLDGLNAMARRKTSDDNKNLPSTENMHRVRNPQNQAGQKRGIKASRSLDGLSSMARKRPSNEKEIQRKSAHKDLNVGSDHPKNQAGKKRFIRPTKSLDGLQRRPAIEKKISQPNRSASLTVGSAPTKEGNPPRNQAGQNRGVKQSKSLDGLSAMQRRSAGDIAGQPKRTSISKNQAGQKRGVRPARSFDGLSKLPPRSTHSSASAGPGSRNATGNQAGQQRGIRAARSFDGLSSMSQRPTPGSNNGIPNIRPAAGGAPMSRSNPPRNQAGQQRGVRPSRSLEGLSSMPQRQSSGSVQKSGSGELPSNQVSGNQAGQQRGIRPSRSLEGLGSMQPKKRRGRNASLEPVNLAGRQRGIRQTRSLEGLHKSLPPATTKFTDDHSIANDSTHSSGSSSSEDEDAKPAFVNEKRSSDASKTLPPPPARMLSPVISQRKSQIHTNDTRADELGSSTSPPSSATPSSAKVTPKKHQPKNLAGQQRGIKAARSLDGLNSMSSRKPNVNRFDNMGGLSSSLPPTMAASTRNPPKKHQPKNLAGQQRGIKAARSLDGLNSIGQERGVQQSRSLEDLSAACPMKATVSSGTETNSPSGIKTNLCNTCEALPRQPTRELSPKQPPKKHLPQNRAGQTRGIKASRSFDGLTRSMPPLRRASNDSDLVRSTSVSGAPDSAPVGNQAGQRRGVQPSRSLDGLNAMVSKKKHAPKNLKDELRRSNHELETLRKRGNSQEPSPRQPPKKHLPQNRAGQTRGIKASRSLDGLAKPMPPLRRASNDSGLARSTSVGGTQDPPKKHFPQNRAGQTRGIKASRSFDGLTMSLPPVRQTSSDAGLARSTSVSGAPDSAPVGNQAGQRRGDIASMNFVETLESDLGAEDEIEASKAALAAANKRTSGKGLFDSFESDYDSADFRKEESDESSVDESSVESELDVDDEEEGQTRQFKAAIEGILPIDQSNVDHSDFSEESDFEESFAHGSFVSSRAATGAPVMPRRPAENNDSISKFGSFVSNQGLLPGNEDISDGNGQDSKRRPSVLHTTNSLEENEDSTTTPPGISASRNGARHSTNMPKLKRQISLEEMVHPSSDDESFSSLDAAPDKAPPKKFWDGKADIEALVKDIKNKESSEKDRKKKTDDKKKKKKKRGKKKKRDKKKKRGKKGDESVSSESLPDDSSEDIDLSSFDVPMDWQPETKSKGMSASRPSIQDPFGESNSSGMDWQPVVNVDMETIVRQKEERERQERSKQIRATLKADLEEPTDLLASLSRPAYMRDHEVPSRGGHSRASISMKQEEIRAQLQDDMAEPVDIASMIRSSHQR